MRNFSHGEFYDFPNGSMGSEKMHGFMSNIYIIQGHDAGTTLCCVDVNEIRARVTMDHEHYKGIN